MEEGTPLRFVVFARAWALAVLFGMMSQLMATTPHRIVVCLAAAVVLVLPRPATLLALAVAYPLHWGQDVYRHDYVHTWLAMLFSVAQVVSLLLTFDRLRWAERFVETFAPVGVALAGVSLFAAGFAKLNVDFANPATSCAPIFYAHQHTTFPFSLAPDIPGAADLSIPFTQIAEVGGSLLVLAHRRTRRLGFVVAWTFLFLAGTNPLGRLYEFTSLFLALMLLAFRWEPVPWRVPRAASVATAVVTLVLVAWAMSMDAPARSLALRFDLARMLYVLVALTLLVAVLWRARSVPLGGGGWRAVPAWVVLAVHVAHESMPYLGVRSERNLSMAGNLMVNTERSNHWIVREVPELPFNHLAILDRSSDPDLDKRGRMAWVDWKLEDYLARHPDVSVTYRLDGETVVVARAGDERRFRRSWLAHFLPVMPTRVSPGPNACGKPMPTSD